MQGNGAKYTMFHPSESHLTKTERAIQAIRDAVLRGTFHAGEQFTLVELAAQLGMSPTPVREAVRTLQAEGLLHQTPHHTITAITFTEQDVIDVFELRVVLEGHATRLAAPRMDAPAFARLEAVLAQMRAALAAEDFPRIHRLNAEWHLAIYQMSDNQALIETIQTLWKKFLWEALWSMPTHSQVSIEQHEEIMQALRDQDADLATRLMSAHMLHGQASAVAFARAQRAVAPPPGPLPIEDGEGEIMDSEQ